MKGGPVPFGKYLLVDRINVGGMAEVFMAKAFGVEGFERVLAIKRILPNMADDDEFINMFVDEARIAVQLSHANVVQVYELGKYENQYYIAMEYVSGKDLRQILDAYRKKGQTLPIPAAAFIAGKICEGLDYAHRKADPTGRPINVIHRDVSPQNILVGFEGAVKITDFGIAKAEDRASKTQAGVLKGKFGYMSPEQVRGLTIDHRSDIFAVGILLYEMVTGKRLFIGESDFSTLEKVRNAEVVPPRQHNPAVSEALERVMLKALARERDERYAWASDLHDDLQQFLIEDNTVFNAKRVSALLEKEFVDDIGKERARMEEFARAQMPSSYHAPEPTPAGPHTAAADNRSEKTMIFESAPEPKVGRGGGTEARKGAPVDDDLAATGAARVSVVAKKPVAGAAPGKAAAKSKAPARKSRAGLVIVGLALVVSAAVLGTVLFGLPPSGTGTIVVTSEPVTEVEIFLDEKPIGTRTPITRTDVPTGVHTLRARARGYTEKMYRFELEGSAVIPVRLEAAVGATAAPAPAGPSGAPSPGTRPVVAAPAPGQAGAGQGRVAAVTVEVLSDPPEAKVRVGGIPQGVTPVTLTHPDAQQALVFEVSKPDFKTVTETVTFKPGETRRTVTVKLAPAVGTAVRSKLLVRSTPDGATVWSGPNRLGVTPLEIPNLDPAQSYSLRLAKDGFREYEATVAMQGRVEVTVSADLDKLKPAAGHKGTAAAEKTREPAPAATAKEPKEPKETREPPKESGGAATAAAGCAGTAGKLSVMAKGEPDCKVTVGRTSLGVSPFLNKDAPTGRCEILVSCPSGKKYTETRTLKAGSPEKLIIEAAMWK